MISEDSKIRRLIPRVFVLLRNLNQLRRNLRLPGAPAGSLAIRHVDAGSCNGCEHELGAAASPFYDLARYGVSVTASPRHADVLVVTGPVTRHMCEPLVRAYAAMPEPRLVAALGDCPLRRHVVADPADLGPPLDSLLPVAVRIPGCPPTPSQIIAGLEPLLAGSPPAN